MSHSKQTKHGFSLYIEKWNGSAKKYINTCILCGHKGYDPIIENKEFCKNARNKVIHNELTKILTVMQLDEFGRCEQCAWVQDHKES